MSEINKNDSLLNIANKIVSVCSGLGLQIFYTDDLAQLWEEQPRGKVSPEMFDWDEAQGNYEMFLETGKKLGVGLVYMQLGKFSWQEDIYDRLIGDDPDEEVAPDIKSTLAKAEKYKAYEGFGDELIVAFKHNNIWHTYQEYPKWQSEYLELLTPSATQRFADAYEEEDESGPSEEEKDKYARALVKEADFSRMKKEALRYTLKKKFPEEFVDFELYVPEIISIAKGIYDTEIRPGKEEKLAKSARELLRAGNSRKKTSDTLGITPKVLSEILERYEE